MFLTSKFEGGKGGFTYSSPSGGGVKGKVARIEGVSDCEKHRLSLTPGARPNQVYIYWDWGGCRSIKIGVEELHRSLIIKTCSAIRIGFR